MSLPPSIEPAHWTEADEMRAHGLGIIIAATTMESLNVCCCLAVLGHADFISDHCTFCGRRRNYARAQMTFPVEPSRLPDSTES